MEAQLQANLQLQNQLILNEEIRRNSQTCFNAVERLAPFDGNRKRLMDFVTTIDGLTPTLNTLSEAEKATILCNIKSKLEGRAFDTVLAQTGNVTNWPDIKQCLIQNFGEHTPINVLEERLRAVRFTSNVKNLYEECIKNQSRIMNAYLLQGTLTDANTARINTLALQTFRTNLPEPVKSIIYVRNPEDIRSAFQIIQAADYTYFEGFNPIRRQNNFQPNRNYYNNQYSPSYPPQQYNNWQQNEPIRQTTNYNNQHLTNRQFTNYNNQPTNNRQNRDRTNNQAQNNFRSNTQYNGQQYYNRQNHQYNNNRERQNNQYNNNRERQNPHNNQPNNDQSMRTIRSHNVNLPEPMDLYNAEHTEPTPRAGPSNLLNENFQGGNSAQFLT